MRHTREPFADVAKAIPALAPMARTTVRLHPRKGEVDSAASHMGGPIMWPADVPWPSCPEHESALVPVLQLKRSDFPEMLFPAGTDLFHLLWCPQDHDDTWTVRPFSYWWEAGRSLQVIDPEPSEVEPEGDYLPQPCVLHPERVVEYPSPFELGDDISELIGVSRELLDAAPLAKLDDAPVLYQYCLSAADGTKIGGWVKWIQDPQVPACELGHEMVHLLTVSSAEFDGGSYPRWLAVEDEAVWGASYAVRSGVQSAAGLMLGDMGDLYIFVCPECGDGRTASVCQCS